MARRGQTVIRQAIAERSLARGFGGTTTTPAQQGPSATQPAASAGIVRRRRATVTGTNAGPPPTVTLNIGGVLVAGVRYLTSYSPTVNDVVILDIVDGDPVVLGELA